MPSPYYCPPPWHRGFNTAADLTNLLRISGLTRTALARLAGVERHAVSYHEKRKGRVDGPVPRRFREAFEKLGYKVPGWREPPVPAAPDKAKRHHVAGDRCGAKTRQGNPCQCKALANGRCKFHGGMSTGPKTAEGKARIVAARLARAERDRHALEA